MKNQKPVRMAMVVTALLWAGCKEGGATAKKVAEERTHVVESQGKRIAAGPASDLRLSPGASFATYLLNAKKPPIDGIPPQLKLGELWAAPLNGGDPKKLGSSVINTPGGWMFTSDGEHVLWIEDYVFATTSGTLKVAPLRGEGGEDKLANQVSYVVTSADGKQVAFVSDGVLRVGPLPKGPFPKVAGEVSTASFTPDSKQVLFRRKLAAAGGLFVVSADIQSTPLPSPKRLADYVGEYELSPDGKLDGKQEGTRIAFSARSAEDPAYQDLFVAQAPNFVPKKIGSKAWLFAFSPDGKYLARTEGWKSSEEGGDLYVGLADGSNGKKVGDKVGRFSFSPDSTALAYLEFYDPNANGGAGVLGYVELPDGKPKRIGNRVPNYRWGSDGKRIAFLSRFIKPIYSVDLMMYSRGEDQSVKVQPGAFGYSFSSENARLLFRTDCVRDGRACNLFMVDPESKELTKQKVLSGLYTFDVAPEGTRMLVTYPRWEGKTVDLSVFDLKSKKDKLIESHVVLPPLFAKKDGSEVAYLVEDGARSGVYVASGFDR